MKSIFKYLYVIVLCYPILSFGGNTRDTDKCKLEPNLNTRNFCLAIAEMSIGYCDRITSFENKMLCFRIVRENQRKTIQGVKTLDDSNTEKR